MKHGAFRKAVALFITVAMLIALPLSVTAIAAGSEYDPIIYVTDMSESVLYSNPNTVNAATVLDRSSKNFLTYATKVFAGIITAALVGSYENGLTLVEDGINGIMSPIACNVDGSAAYSNIGPWYYGLPISKYHEDEIYTESMQAIIKAASGKVSENEIFVFTYDWRIDPLENGGSLLEYIEHVKAYTGSEKVSLIAGGYGGIVTNCYLNQYDDHAAKSVSSCVFLDTDITGNSIIGDLMKGELTETFLDGESLIDAIYNVTGEARGKALLNYINDDPNGIITNIFIKILGNSTYTKYISALAVYLTAYIINDQNMWKKAGDAYNKFVIVKDDALYDDCLREHLRNMPGLWAMLSEDDYEEARDFMYKNDVMDTELERKVTSYRNVLADTEDTLRAAQKAGISVSLVAGYNIQILPATATIDEQSDGIVSTKYASAGATTADLNDIWYRADQCVEDNHNHLSTDKMIDASTCMLPENTWFIKNHTHLDYSSETSADFIIWLINPNVQRNVWQNAAYPQYLSYSKYTEKLSSNLSVDGLSGGDFKLGDLDVDGKITSADARQALRYAVKLDSASKILRTVGDVDGDGDITSADARLILRYAVGLIKNFNQKG